MSRSGAIQAAVLLAVLPLGAARGGEPVIPAAYRGIVDLAGAAPAEFGADALLRVVETGKIEDKPTRAALIERAFAMAEGAREPMRRRVVHGAGVDTLAGMRSVAYGLTLDAESLEARAVKLMLKLSPGRARAMFGEMTRPSLDPLKCTDALVYDVSAYYEALGEVLDRAFTPAEKAREDQVNFALGALAGMRSPVEVAPAVRMVERAAAFTQAQREIVESRLGAVMEAMEADDRSYEEVRADIDAVLPAGLRGEAAKFGQRMRAAEACGVPAAAGQGAAVDPNAAQAKATMPEAKPLWTAPEAKTILATARDIRFPGGAAFPKSVPAGTDDFVDRFNAMLNDVAAWQQPEGDDPFAYFHEKCTLYEGLVDVAPAGAPRRRLTEDFAAYLAASSVQSDEPEDWYLHARDMIHRIPYTTEAEHEQALDAFTKTGNAALTLLVVLEQKIPPHVGVTN